MACFVRRTVFTVNGVKKQGSKSNFQIQGHSMKTSTAFILITIRNSCQLNANIYKTHVPILD